MVPKFQSTWPWNLAIYLSWGLEPVSRSFLRADPRELIIPEGRKDYIVGVPGRHRAVFSDGFGRRDARVAILLPRALLGSMKSILSWVVTS